MLSTTTSMVKLLSEIGKVIGRVTPGQAAALASSGVVFGGGSTHKVRYLQFKPHEMTVSQQLFCKHHELPAYDPTLFRTFAFPSGIAPDQRTGAVSSKRK